MPKLGQKPRYGNTSNAIVASARNEVDISYQSSTLPRSRLSMEVVGGFGGQAAAKKGFDYPVPGGKLSIGLPPMRREGSSGSGTKIQTMQSLNMSTGMERVSMYRNEEDRQSMMKHINEQ